MKIVLNYDPNTGELTTNDGEVLAQVSNLGDNALHLPDYTNAEPPEIEEHKPAAIEEAVCTLNLRIAKVESKADDAGKPERDTAIFRHANMRVDYVLPDRRVRLRESRVFWPRRDSDDYPLIADSDHRMVWIKVEIP